MKKYIALLCACVLLLPAAACGNDSSLPAGSQDAASSAETTDASQAEPPAAEITLVNKMTETERSRVSRHGLTLLDPPPEAEPAAEAPQPDAAHKVEIEFHTTTIEELREYAEYARKEKTDSEYEELLAWIKNAEETGEGLSTYAQYVLVDGVMLSYPLPDETAFTEGNPFVLVSSSMDEDEKIESAEYSFDTMEEYLSHIREDSIENGFSEAEADLEAERMQIAYDAYLGKTYETLPEGTVDPNDMSLYARGSGENADYRDKWEYDRSEVEAIRDAVEEIGIYDEEMRTDFLVHVTLPPDYDSSRAYPVFLLTDAVWRFGNVPALRKLIADGEAAPVLLVTLGYGYNRDGAEGDGRYNDLVIERDKLLDFVTDNLMPYLGECYRIDYAASTLYGHSDGGVFAHNALCKSDLYENQPFGKYIIGSPALWGLYNYLDHFGNSAAIDEVLNDYGYFDRNEKMNKTVFLCAGAQEDPDYADSYNGRDTTLEGVEKLKNRLEAHGADLTYKLYESHHYQYIPEMLTEYLKATYPPAPAN